METVNQANVDPNLAAGGAVEIDPLATPASAVDVSFPKLMPERLYAMEVAKVEKKVNDKGVGMVKIMLKTTAEAQTDDGKPVNPGFPIHENWVYSPTGDLTAEQIRKQGAIILRSCGMGDAPVAVLRDNPEMIVGKVITVKIRTQKEKDGFPARSSVSQWIEPKAAAAV